MTIPAFEGIIENGQIRLRDNVTLPENAKVYVIIPNFNSQPESHVYSPQLVHPEQARDFNKQVIEVSSDSEL